MAKRTKPDPVVTQVEEDGVVKTITTHPHSPDILRFLKESGAKVPPPYRVIEYTRTGIKVTCDNDYIPDDYLNRIVDAVSDLLYSRAEAVTILKGVLTIRGCDMSGYPFDVITLKFHAMETKGFLDGVVSLLKSIEKNHEPAGTRSGV